MSGLAKNKTNYISMVDKSDTLIKRQGDFLSTQVLNKYV